MTYQELYFEKAKLAKSLNKEETAVKLLISHYSNFPITELYLNYHKEVSTNIIGPLEEAMKEYLYKNKPVQYLIGYTYFYKLKLLTHNNVLIPRPETEELVETILSYLKETKAYRILDIGTGSGAISLALKANHPKSEMIGADISRDAIKLATRNKELNNLDVHFIYSDVFSNVEGKFDVIVSNPPYIDPSEEVDEIVQLNEPHLALYAEMGGLYYYDKILKEAKDFLCDSFLIAFEIPENKDEKLKEIVNAYFPMCYFEIKKDLNQLSRILIVTNFKNGGD